MGFYAEEKGMDLKDVAEEVLERCCTEELICFNKNDGFLHSSCLVKNMERLFVS